MRRRLTVYAAVSFLTVALTANQGCAERNKYPLGLDGRVLTVEYDGHLPMTIYLPDEARRPSPVVVFNHGRPFRNIRWRTYKLSERHPFVDNLTRQGFAVAVPIRAGYHSAPGRDGEKIACNAPPRGHFQRALTSGKGNILAAIERLKGLPQIDTSRVFVAGTSGGGFLTLGSLDAYPDNVRGVISFNGGRCGRRGTYFRGLEYAAELISTAAARSDIPVLVVASTRDRTIPAPSSYALTNAICKARQEKCKSTVFLANAVGAGHGFKSTASHSIRYVLDFMNRFDIWPAHQAPKS